jgi:hypothetical protein
MKNVTVKEGESSIRVAVILVIAIPVVLAVIRYFGGV